MPSVSVDMADIAVLSDGESTSSDSSLDTVVEISQDETDRNTTNPATESNIEKSDRTKEKLQQDAVTAEVLANLFADAAEELRPRNCNFNKNNKNYNHHQNSSPRQTPAPTHRKNHQILRTGKSTKTSSVSP